MSATDRHTHTYIHIKCHFETVVSYKCYAKRNRQKLPLLSTICMLANRPSWNETEREFTIHAIRIHPFIHSIPFRFIHTFNVNFSLALSLSFSDYQFQLVILNKHRIELQKPKHTETTPKSYRLINGK